MNGQPTQPAFSTWENRYTFAAQLGPDANLLLDWTATPRPEGIVPIRPLGLGDILGGAFRAVRFNARATFGMTLLLIIGVQLILVLLSAAIATLSGGSAGDLDSLLNFLNSYAGIFALLGGTALTGAAQLVALLTLTPALSYVVCEAVTGRRVTPREMLRRMRQRLGATLGFGLLVLSCVAAGLFVLGFFLSAGDIAVVLFISLSAIGVILAASVKLLFVLPIIAVEGVGPLTAARRSWRLTSGRFWRTFGIKTLASVLIGMAASTLTGLLSIVSMVISLENLMVSVVSLIAVTTLSITITLPLETAVTALLYTDARIRDEALDLALTEESFQ